jgi:endo-alpha-1,4-polygalactosaminidase (GH114 family)
MTYRTRKQAQLIKDIDTRWENDMIVAYWNNPPRTKQGKVTQAALKVTDAIIEVAKLRNIQLPCN